MNPWKSGSVAVAAGALIVVIFAAFGIDRSFAAETKDGDVALKEDGYRAANFVVG